MKRRSINTEMSANKKINLVESSKVVSGFEVNAVNCNKTSSGDVLELVRELETADAFVQASMRNKLQVVTEQMHALSAHAHKIIAEAKRNNELNQVACNFVKQPGHVYHLYRRPSGQLYFGMLSPEEWLSCPHEYVDSYRFEFDRSYTPVDQIDNKDVVLKLLRACGVDKMLL